MHVNDNCSNLCFVQGNAGFHYVDVWSSPFSWNYNMPEEGDLVIIPSGQTILLDTTTPILKMLLIQGLINLSLLKLNEYIIETH